MVNTHVACNDRMFRRPSVRGGRPEVGGRPVRPERILLASPGRATRCLSCFETTEVPFSAKNERPPPTSAKSAPSASQPGHRSFARHLQDQGLDSSSGHEFPPGKLRRVRNKTRTKSLRVLAQVSHCCYADFPCPRMWFT